MTLARFSCFESIHFMKVNVVFDTYFVHLYRVSDMHESLNTAGLQSAVYTTTVLWQPVLSISQALK